MRFMDDSILGICRSTICRDAKKRYSQSGVMFME